MEPELTFERETVEISGGRNLYNYRFFLDGEPMDEMQADDIQPMTPATTDAPK